jgi:hypothetical protein
MSVLVPKSKEPEILFGWLFHCPVSLVPNAVQVEFHKPVIKVPSQIFGKESVNLVF